MPPVVLLMSIPLCMWVALSAILWEGAHSQTPRTRDKFRPLLRLCGVMAAINIVGIVAAIVFHNLN